MARDLECDDQSAVILGREDRIGLTAAEASAPAGTEVVVFVIAAAVIQGGLEEIIPAGGHLDGEGLCGSPLWLQPKIGHR